MALPIARGSGGAAGIGGGELQGERPPRLVTLDLEHGAGAPAVEAPRPHALAHLERAGVAVDPPDAIARPQARPFGRAAGQHVEHLEAVALHQPLELVLVPEPDLEPSRAERREARQDPQADFPGEVPARPLVGVAVLA